MPWDGIPLLGDTLAFDTETTVVDLAREIPDMVLATVTDGRRHVVLGPKDMPAFVSSHHNRVWVAFNLKFDFWVVRQLLGNSLPGGLWEEILDQGRFRDLMLQDQLLRLATGEDRGICKPRQLLQVCLDYLGIKLDKSDEHRMHFDKLIGQDWSRPEFKPFIDYAVLDTVATYRAWKLVDHRLDNVSGTYDKRWGRLTELLQVRADIVLADMGRQGFAIDSIKLSETRSRLSAVVEEQVAALRASHPDLFPVYVEKKRAGELRLNKNTGVPHLKQAALQQILEQVAQQEGIDPKFLPRTPKTGLLRASLDDWRDLAPDNEFIQRWSTLSDTGKLLQFIVQLEQQKGLAVNPEYSVLVRTGRTSAKRPNLQQMPREPWFRSLFVARPGCKLVIADYSAIELRTLAAVLEDRYGQSVLADVLREGRDPHCYTAALVLGEDYEHVKAEVKREKGLPEGSPKLYSRARQAAKAINFGVPGGLGAGRLAIYAKRTYGVDLSVKEAQALRKRLIEDVYPELSQYLSDDPVPRLAKALCAEVEDVRAWGEASPGRLFGAERILAGRTMAGGQEYDESTREKVWQALAELNQNPALVEALASRQPSNQLAIRLFGQPVWTLTRRARAACQYTEARNTPFQGLAADGAKAALWELFRRGFKLVAFIHDEVVAEVPEDQAEAKAKELVMVMQQEMAKVLYTDIPVEVEYAIADRWTK